MILLLILPAGLSLYILNIIYRKLWSRNLSVTLSFDSEAVYAGGSAVLYEVIENRKRLPVPFLEIGFRIQKGLSLPDAENTSTSDYIYKRDLFSLLGMEQIKRRYTASCPKRGCYSFSQQEISCRSLLFQYIYKEEFSSDDRLYVYAARTDISGILPVFESLYGEQESARHYFEDPFAFSGIRSYTIQDPMKTINWKASAKTGELMVNTYASVLSSQIMVYLDVGDRFLLKKHDLLEEGIATAATLLRRMLGEGMEAGILVNAESPFYLPPARGSSQLSSIEQFLTEDFSNMDLMDFGECLKAAPSLEGDSSVFPVFISINADETMKQQIIDLLGKELHGLWIVPVEEGADITVTSGPNLTIMKKVLPNEKHYA